MHTAPASRLRRRGQALPLFAGSIGTLLLMAGLLIDGALLFQGQRDLEVIAWHAARAGAQHVVVDAAGNVSITAAGSAAANDAACDWVAQSQGQFLALPTRAFGAGCGAATSRSGDSMTVTIRRCYSPFLIGLVGIAGQCGGGSVYISATATARAYPGN
jgi:Flp pilus assembly protein TadG